METPRTCGQGLAANAPLPAHLAHLVAAMAEILELHTEALDAGDDDARAELELYQRLAALQRQTADQLRAVAREMSGALDLPMAPHDLEAMASGPPRAAFGRFVELEEELLVLLQKRLQSDRRMLAEMRVPA